jgi:hypothetical protein
MTEQRSRRSTVSVAFLLEQMDQRFGRAMHGEGSREREQRAEEEEIFEGGDERHSISHLLVSALALLAPFLADHRFELIERPSIFAHQVNKR